MPRLPVPGADEGVWGDYLNEYLLVEHKPDGTLKRAAEFAAKYDKPAGGIPPTDLDTSSAASGQVIKFNGTTVVWAAESAGGSDYQPLSANLTAFSSKTAPSGDVVGTTDTQSLTNKTLTSPKLSGEIRDTNNAPVITFTPNGGATDVDINGLIVNSVGLITQNGWLRATSTITGVTIGASSSNTYAGITVTGAEVADIAVAAPPAAIPAGVTWSATVTALNTVTITATNTTGSPVDVPTGDWGIAVFK